MIEKDSKKEQYSAKDFIDKLYTTVFDWLTKDQKGEIVGHVNLQEINNWDTHEANPGQITQLSAHLLQAAFIKTNEYDWALVLALRRRSKYDHKETVGLQFGLKPSIDSKSALVDKLKALTSDNVSLGHGDFYIDSKTGRIQINCFTDRQMFAGQEINKWEEDKLLTDKGIQACLKIVQRTKNAFL